jgi:hypothetical protein
MKVIDVGDLSPRTPRKLIIPENPPLLDWI